MIVSRYAVMLAALVMLLAGFSSEPSLANSADANLAGLWAAKKSFGPEISGTLIIEERDGAYTADIAGRRIVVSADGDGLSFSLPANDAGDFLGEFKGSFEKNRAEIKGRWIQPRSPVHGSKFASPVRLKKTGKHRWAGEVRPLPDEFSIFLKLQTREDGSLGGFIRNPDRNIGVFMQLDHIEQDGGKLQFFGSFFGRGEPNVMAEGYYNAETDTIVIDLPYNGGAYTFARDTNNGASNFYARSAEPRPYRYTPPIARNDGWKTATLEDAGIDFEPIRQLIEKEIDPAADDVHDMYIHGILIARHGNLVFEDYFHGYHRDKAHDTRSASKSLTSTLIGAAIEAGLPVSTGMPVYETMYDGNPPQDIDPRKNQITMEHLLTMSSGFYCDDSDSNAPGNEDVMQSQEEEPDWYRYTLNVPMAYEPGEKGVYCSANPNLAGGVLNRATGVQLETLFENLIAAPLQIDRYYLNLSPTDEPYMGGGIYWLPRDFMKLGQLMLDGGVWNGKRIVSKAWAEKASSPLIEIRDRNYGYLWWIDEYEHNGKTLRAILAGGNGGNIVVAIPEFDLVIAFFGGNYSDRVLYRSQNEFIPNYILPAVHDD